MDKNGRKYAYENAFISAENETNYVTKQTAVISKVTSFETSDLPETVAPGRIPLA